MTRGRFREVDHDLLADYLGGALDGTPEQSEIARLVDDDPAWGEAYAALAPAVDLVRADLADWAAAPAPELPLTVADRIAAALAGAGPAPTHTDLPAPRGTVDPDDAAADVDLAAPGSQRRPRGAGTASGAPVTVPAQNTGGPGRGGGATRPAEGPGRATGPGRRRRRWTRLAGPVALAAASITAVGLGVNHLVGTAGGGGGPVTAQDRGTERAAGPGAPGALAAAPFRTTGPASRSGTDYTPEQLSGAIRTAVPRASTSTAKSLTEGADADQRLGVGGDLGRLAGRDALDACLAAVAGEHAGGVVTVDLVDYASFQGQPALVVTFVDAGGARWAWVSGPECGVPGSGADTRFRTRVG